MNLLEMLVTIAVVWSVLAAATLAVYLGVMAVFFGRNPWAREGR